MGEHGRCHSWLLDSRCAVCSGFGGKRSRGRRDPPTDWAFPDRLCALGCTLQIHSPTGPWVWGHAELLACLLAACQTTSAGFIPYQLPVTSYQTVGVPYVSWFWRGNCLRRPTECFGLEEFSAPSHLFPWFSICRRPGGSPPRPITILTDASLLPRATISIMRISSCSVFAVSPLAGLCRMRSF